MMLFEVDGLSFSAVTGNVGKVVIVEDKHNGHKAELAQNAAGVFYIVNSTFPHGGKRYFEMLYAAEVNKRRLI